MSKGFADYQKDGNLWITLATGEYYPDILPEACALYKPILVRFGQLLKESSSSQELFRLINETTDSWTRVQLCRIFRKYASPETPVEMLKRKLDGPKIIQHYGKKFRKITVLQEKFESRPMPDEALCAILWEYKDRGKKGYDLTEKLFLILRANFPTLTISGPERAGKDILLGKLLPDYPKPDRPVDFVIQDNKKQVLAIGLARYDSDRGGAQEDDRPGQYRECAAEILKYSKKNKKNIKVIFLNDGPGLLLGSMWRDYARIESQFPDLVKVVTLRMISDRITLKWLKGGA